MLQGLRRSPCREKHTPVRGDKIAGEIVRAAQLVDSLGVFTGWMQVCESGLPVRTGELWVRRDKLGTRGSNRVEGVFNASFRWIESGQ
jgi:hypothetical protein